MKRSVCDSCGTPVDLDENGIYICPECGREEVSCKSCTHMHVETQRCIAGAPCFLGSLFNGGNSNE